MKNNVFLHCISSFKSNSWKDTATRSFTLADRPIIFQKSLELHSSQHCLKKKIFVMSFPFLRLTQLPPPMSHPLTAKIC